MRIFPLSLSIMLALALAALAQEPPSKKAEAPAPAKPAEQGEGRVIVTEHTVNIGGQAVAYKVSTGYLVQKEETEKQDQKGEKPEAGAGKDSVRAKARIFFIAYTRAGVEPGTRPLSFAFNGGPGAASVWLHLGALGPRRVKLAELGRGTPPPYALVDNEFSWLDETDLVFIDPVSTGYSRPAPGETARSFHGYQEDLQSVAEFIRQYTTQNNRWLSPKFLIGESYGGLRAAALADVLQERFDLYLNGIVIVSGLLNWQVIDFRSGNDLPFALFLPAYTVAAHFHQKLPPDLQRKPTADARREAEDFASKEYPLALAKGNALTPAERSQIAGQLARLSGVGADVFLRYNLRLPAGQFMDELLKSDRRSIGRFDSRLTGVMSDPDNSDFDPSFTTMRGNFTAAINAYVRGELRFESELPYRSLADVSPWSFGPSNRYLDVGDSLTRAINKNPALKVWVIAGCFDLAISYFATDYSLRQMQLAPELKANLRFSKYDSGHMLYTDTAFLKPLKDDFSSFLRAALK